MNCAADSRPEFSRLRERKYLVLLVAIVALLVVQPLLVHWSVRTRVLGDAVFMAVVFCVFLVVFEQRGERRLALSLVILGLSSLFVYHGGANRLQMAAIVSYHCLAVAFFGFAVTVILRRVFSRETIHSDQIIGVACGYLLAALAWSSLFALVHVVAPGSFRVPEEMVSQLTDWHTRRSLFDYFSIVTLTGLGYGDITPTNPPVYALVAMEVVFGLFYLAVVVSQLVGLMMIRRADKNGAS